MWSSSGAQLVRNRDLGLIGAVAEANPLAPRPDFVIHGRNWPGWTATPGSTAFVISRGYRL